jgi:hypothetical protein
MNNDTATWPQRVENVMEKTRDMAIDTGRKQRSCGHNRKNGTRNKASYKTQNVTDNMAVSRQEMSKTREE